MAKNARGDYSEDFHTYSLEWTPDYLITCEFINAWLVVDGFNSKVILRVTMLLVTLDIDSRIKQVLSLKTNKQTFWERGEFPNSYINGTDEVAVVSPRSHHRPHYLFRTNS